MPTFEVTVPVGANQIWMKQQISAAIAEATRRGKLRPELRRFDHRRELRRQPRPRHADHPLRAVGARRHRGQADPQGRRLREHERAVLAARRARSSRPRRSDARRRAQVHPPRGLEGAGQGLQPGRRRRLHRRRPHVGVSAREGTAVPHARRRESRSATGGARSLDHGRRPTSSPSDRWGSAARRRSSAARSRRSTACPPASSCRSPTTAGRFAGSASGSIARTGAITSWLYRDGDDRVGRRC